MGLHDQVRLLFICVMFYQITDIACYPRRCKNNCAYQLRNPSIHKYGKQTNRPIKVCKDAVIKSPVPDLKWEVPVVPVVDNNYCPITCLAPAAVKKTSQLSIPVSDKVWSIPSVSEFETTCQSKLCHKSHTGTENKDRLKTPVTECSREVPEVYDFESNFDLSKLCLTPSPLPVCKECKCSTIGSAPFDQFPEPFCFKEKGSFPEVDYPMDVKDIRIPNYWNDFVEEKLKKQAKEIDQACTQIYQGKQNTKPKPQNQAIDKAVKALLKSQALNKASETTKVPSNCLSESNKCDGPSNETEAETFKNNINNQVGGFVKNTLKENEVSKSAEKQSLPETNNNILDIVNPPKKDTICKPTEDVITEQFTEKSTSASTNDKLPEPIQNIVEPQTRDIISNCTETVPAETLLEDNAIITENKELPPTNKKVVNSIPNVVESIISTQPQLEGSKSIGKNSRSMTESNGLNPILDMVEPQVTNMITNPIKNTFNSAANEALPPTTNTELDLDNTVKDFFSKTPNILGTLPVGETIFTSTEKNIQNQNNKTVSMLTEDIKCCPAEESEDVSKTIETIPVSSKETTCLSDGCSSIPISSSKPEDAPTTYENHKNIHETNNILDPITSTIAPLLPELPTKSVSTAKVDKSGVKKILMDSLLSISNMDDTTKETLDAPAQNTLAEDEDIFGFATLSPTDEELPRVARSCLDRDPSLFLCPEDVDYMILVSI